MSYYYRYNTQPLCWRVQLYRTFMKRNLKMLISQFCLYVQDFTSRELFSDHVLFSPTCRPLLADNWYSLSYLYFSPIGTITAISVGLLVSLFTGK